MIAKPGRNLHGEITGVISRYGVLTRVTALLVDINRDNVGPQLPAPHAHKPWTQLGRHGDHELPFLQLRVDRVNRLQVDKFDRVTSLESSAREVQRVLPMSCILILKIQMRG